jgi:acyl carrier protein
MGDRNMEEIIKGLRDFLNTELNIGNDIEIKGETELIEIGVDSIALMTLLVFIEEEYGLEVSEDILIEDNFKCVSDIAAYIHSRIK